MTPVSTATVSYVFQEEDDDEYVHVEMPKETPGSENQTLAKYSPPSFDVISPRFHNAPSDDETAETPLLGHAHKIELKQVEEEIYEADPNADTIDSRMKKVFIGCLSVIGIVSLLVWVGQKNRQ